MPMSFVFVFVSLFILIKSKPGVGQVYATSGVLVVGRSVGNGC